MAETVLNQVDRTRRHLLGMHRAEYNRLASTVNGAATTITTSYDAEAIGPGSFICIDDELIYVWDTSGTDLTVQRGMLGTDAATHTGGDLIEVNPRFPKPVIKDALREEIRAWNPMIWQKTAVELSVTAGRRDVDITSIPSEWIDILDVFRAPRTGLTEWFTIPFRAQRDLDAGDYASGTALILDSPIEKTADVRVVYAKPIDPETAWVDATTLASMGLATTAYDIAPLGAVARLVAGLDVRRSMLEGQPEPRNAAEVPVGANTQVARAFRSAADLAIKREAARLRKPYPYRKF